jgi:ABC-type proline/glycine betaine transport system permease subunit
MYYLSYMMLPLQCAAYGMWDAARGMSYVLYVVCLVPLPLPLPYAVCGLRFAAYITVYYHHHQSASAY